MVRRKADTKALALLGDHFEREAGVCIGSLQHGGNAEPPCLFERRNCAERPGVNEIYLPGEPGEAASDDPVVRDQRPQLSDGAIRQAKSTA